MKNRLLSLASFALVLLAAPTLVSAQMADVAGPNVSRSDVSAIKAVIERETDSFFNRDAATSANCWANVPYASQLHAYTTPDGKSAVYFGGNAKTDLPQQVASAVKSMGKPDGMIASRANYNIRVNGNAAFVTFDQTNTIATGDKQYVRETRYLEKLKQANGSAQWKIIHVTAIAYTPEQP